MAGALSWRGLGEGRGGRRRGGVGLGESRGQPALGHRPHPAADSFYT